MRSKNQSFAHQEKKSWETQAHSYDFCIIKLLYGLVHTTS